MTFSVFSACDTSGYVPSEASTAVRWHPGFYILPVYNGSDGVTPTDWTSIKADLLAYDAFRGVQLRFNWNQIEVDEGDYSGIDTVIKPYLDEIAVLSSGATRKYVHILLHIRHSHLNGASSANDMVPDYMIGNATYGGGQWIFGSANPDVPGTGGHLICWWEASVRAKMALMAQALADALNDYTTEDALGQLYNPLEGISVSETATGNQATSGQIANVSFPSGTAPNGEPVYEMMYWEGYYQFVKNLRDAFTNTWTGAFCNHHREAIEVIIQGGSANAFYTGSAAVDGMLSIGSALGNPNTSIDDTGLSASVTTGPPELSPGVFFYYGSGAGKGHGVIPLTPSWQKPDYRWTTLAGVTDPNGHAPTAQELYEFSRDNLHATHVFATYTEESNYFANFKNYLTSTGYRNIVSGGLNATPPSCFSSVSTD